jgi:hypothetical protein
VPSIYKVEVVLDTLFSPLLNDKSLNKCVEAINDNALRCLVSILIDIGLKKVLIGYKDKRSLPSAIRRGRRIM